MTRTPLVVALALLLPAALAAPALAQPEAMRAEFTAPFERERQAIVDGTVWTCSGTTCTAAGDEPRPAIACRKLARKLGPVARFATPRGELDADGLAACNQDHR